MPTHKFKKEDKYGSYQKDSGLTIPLMGARAIPMSASRVRIKGKDTDFEINLDTELLTIDTGSGATDVTSDGAVVICDSLNDTVLFKDAGGSAITTVTKSQLDARVAAGTLTVGKYKLTGTTGQSGLALTAIYFDVLIANTVPKSAQGLFLDADYQGVGDYSSIVDIVGSVDNIYWGDVSAFYDGGVVIANATKGDIYYEVSDNVRTYKILTANATVSDVSISSAIVVSKWDAAFETAPIYNNKVAIFNGLMYPVIDATAFDGTNPTVNTTAYGAALNPLTAGTGYVQSLDPIIYDHPNDWLEFRGPQKGKVWGEAYGGTSFPITDVEWGNDAVTDYDISYGKPKVTKGLLTQSGTDTPTINLVGVDNVGISNTNYEGTGYYKIKSDGKFPIGKTIVDFGGLCVNGNPGFGYLDMSSSTSDFIAIGSTDLIGAPQDGTIVSMPFTISVNP